MPAKNKARAPGGNKGGKGKQGGPPKKKQPQQAAGGGNKASAFFAAGPKGPKATGGIAKKTIKGKGQGARGPIGGKGPKQNQTLGSLAAAAGQSTKVRLPGANAPRNSSGRSTMLVTQPLQSRASRTWGKFGNTAGALEGLIKDFEVELKKLNPYAGKLTYSAADLNQYVDSMVECSLLVEEGNRMFKQQGKGFIKAQLLEKLRRSAK